MKSLAILGACLFLSGEIGAQRASTPDERPLVINHVTVIDSTGAPPRQNVSVVIVGDRIKSIVVDSESKFTPDVKIVDGTGKFLIAGLWDMHVHALSKGQPDRFFPLFVANGVTGIRDMGGDIPLSQIAELKKENSSCTRLGPEIFAAGPILEGEHPFWPFSVSVKNPEDARKRVDQLVEEKADFLKVYNTLSRESYLAVAAEAKAKRFPFAGHIPDGVSPSEASEFGQRSIEHLWGIPNYLSSESEHLAKMIAEANDTEDAKIARDLYYKINQTILKTYDSKKADRLFKEFVSQGTWQTPTLVILRSYAKIHDPEVQKDSRIAYMPRELLKLWNSMGGSPDQRNDEIQMRLFERDLEIVRAMHVANVPILAGTDTPNPYTYPGFSLHEELELLVESGLSSMEALQTATLRAAQFLGVENSFGSVEEGKIANLVLLDKNPLTDIRNTKSIRAVVVRGRFLDRDELNKVLNQQKN